MKKGKKKIMKNIDNYFLNVNWKDLDKNTHRVGFLSLYNEKFYFKIRGKESIQRAYDQGFGGIPGIQAERVYVSANEMFNVIKKRLGIRETEKEKMEIMKELLCNKIESDTILYNRRDRISFEAMTEREVEECRKEIDELERLANKKTDIEK